MSKNAKDILVNNVLEKLKRGEVVSSMTVRFGANSAINAT